MKVSNGTTWDMIAFLNGLDEFTMWEIMGANSYSFADVLTFEGGEEVVINAAPLIESSTIKAPWED